MKISSEEFEIIKDIHSLLLSKKGRGINEDVARKLGLPISSFIKNLKLLKSIGIISNLILNSKVFSCNVVENNILSPELLMKKYDFILSREELKQDIDKEDAHIKRLYEEIDRLRDENDRLKLEIRMLKKYGKSLKEKIKDVEIVSGD